MEMKIKSYLGPRNFVLSFIICSIDYHQHWRKIANAFDCKK